MNDADPDAKGSRRLLLPNALSGKLAYPLLNLGSGPWSAQPDTFRPRPCQPSDSQFQHQQVQPTPSHKEAYSPAVTDYEITDFGVIHEIDRGGPNGNLSMGIHVYGASAWNFR